MIFPACEPLCSQETIYPHQGTKIGKYLLNKLIWSCNESNWTPQKIILKNKLFTKKRVKTFLCQIPIKLLLFRGVGDAYQLGL
jgi:hypothetical protein